MAQFDRQPGGAPDDLSTCMDTEHRETMTRIEDSTTITGRVLIVDDEPHNRELVRDLLEVEGHTVYEARNGTEALRMAATLAPHVILLDVMMPGLDGYEVCRQLKGDANTRAIPVLLVTALHERDERLRGIEAGANDFLTKPIDTRDMALRTRNAVYTKRLYDQVQDNLRDLKTLEELRDNLVHMVVHDMRSLLYGIRGNLELLDTPAVAALPEQDRICLSGAHASTLKLVEMVSQMLDISRLENGQMPLHREPCDLAAVANAATQSLAALLRDHPLTVTAPAGEVRLSCDGPLMQRVLVNLLDNAIRFTPSGSSLELSIEPHRDSVRVALVDRGPGIPPEFHTRIFEKFGQVEPGVRRKKYSTGLGLAFCKLVVEAHGGRIGVESLVGQGSTFWFTLPL